MTTLPRPRARIRRAAAVATLSCVLLGGLQPPADGATPRGVRPVPGPVVGRFDPPAVRWGSGHRGVDLAASPGTPVRTPLAGVVTVATTIVGRGVVVVDHGRYRSTFEPVVASVEVGDIVFRGQVVGRLAPGHSCAAPACLHWGLKVGAEYRNPLSLLGGQVRLLSDADAAAIRGTGG